MKVLNPSRFNYKKFIENGKYNIKNPDEIDKINKILNKNSHTMIPNNIHYNNDFNWKKRGILIIPYDKSLSIEVFNKN